MWSLLCFTLAAGAALASDLMDVDATPTTRHGRSLLVRSRRACGAPGQRCCLPGDRCRGGSECDGGRCTPSCGMPNGACCTSGFACELDMRCSSDPGTEGAVCVEREGAVVLAPMIGCGTEAGAPCCPTGTACEGTLSCTTFPQDTPGAVCFEPCGTMDAPCCVDGAFECRNPNLRCTGVPGAPGATCARVRCGMEQGERCCFFDNNFCAGSLRCVNRVCRF